MKYRSRAHCIYKIQYHLVLVTKYRRKCLTKDMREYIRLLIGDLLDKNDCKLLEFGGEEDHIHILFEAHPSLLLSQFINVAKTNTSRLVRKRYAAYLSKFYWKPVLWTSAYCLLSTGGATLEIIEKYIQNQGIDKRTKEYRNNK